MRKRNDPENLKKPPADTEEWNPLIAYDHDGMGLMSTPRHMSRHPRYKGINKWARYRVAFLLRDPRDVLLSNYFFLVVRGRQVERTSGWAKGYDLDSFFRCKTMGMPHLVRWLLWWEKHRRECRDFLCVHYEDMVETGPLISLSRVLSRVTEEEVPISTMIEAVKASSFEVMRSHERKHGKLFKDQAGIIDSEETAVVRKGKTGQWIAQLPDDLKDWCLEAMEPLRGTFADRYLDKQ